MRQTYTEAKMKFVDVSAKQDAEYITNNVAKITDTSMLKNDNYRLDFALLVDNDFILDGNEYVLNNEEKVPYCSELSDENGIYHGSIVIDFDEVHTSAGITFTFAEDYPEQFKLTWFGRNNVILAEKVFKPDGMIYTCKEQVVNYMKIKIDNVKTRFPFYPLRISNIDFGINLTWSASKIKSAKVLEEVNPISTELSINTADISILDENNDFDIGNENGAWKSVQKTQEITLTEYIDGKPIPMGTFFVDDKSFSNNIASFSMIDAIGLMANYTFYNGRIYNKERAGVILEDIFRTANVSKYSIEDDVYNTELSGWLEIQTCREALQMICFVCGAVADDSRSDTIRIYTVSRSVTATIPISRKFNRKSSIKHDTYVSGVQLACNKYILDDEETEIYSDVLQAGLQTITLTEPYKPDTINAVGCTVVEAKSNYVVVNVPTEQECTISGIKYSSSEFRFQKANEVDAGEAENIIELGTFTLYNASLMPSIAKKVLDYYALRKVVDLSYIVENEHAGNWVNIGDKNNAQATSLIESQSIDLTGGFIATSSCRGYSFVVTEMYYTGEELYAGGVGII